MELKVSLRLSLVICLLLLLREHAVNSKTSLDRPAKVLILGAGISGITAAKTLHENGVDDFVILEAYSRIGGRMRPTDFAGSIVELGANWVQGIKNNPIWVLAEKYDLKGSFTMASPTPGLYVVRNETGHDVTSVDMHEEFKVACDKLDKIVQERREAGKSDIDSRTGIRLAGWQPQNPVQSIVEYLYFDFDAAVAPHYISSRVKMFDNGSIDSVGGKQCFVSDPRGYSCIVDEMAQSFLSPTDSRLRLNQVVSLIEWDPTGVRVSTKTGVVFTADYLLVTFSIGVLKSNSVSFKPELPAQILEPIFKQAMAYYIKIFLKFPERFWDKKQFILYASKRRGYYPIWQDFDVDSGLPDQGSNILLVTVTGEEATRVQFLPDANIQAEIMLVLRRVYGNDIPDATDILCKRWGHDPLFYGSYSNVPIGMTHEDYVALQSNVSRIYFAGEATEELYNGFVHGAYYSGLHLARKILHDLIQNEIK